MEFSVDEPRVVPDVYDPAGDSLAVPRPLDKLMNHDDGSQSSKSDREILEPVKTEANLPISKTSTTEKALS